MDIHSKSVEELLKLIRSMESTHYLRPVYPWKFDPILFLESLKKKANDAGVSDDEHTKNLITLATLGIEEGQNLDRIKKKLSPERKKFLEETEILYGLVSRGSNSIQATTLTRIAGCLTKEISLGISDGTLKINTKVKPEAIAPGFPPFMCLSSFGSIIPIALNFRKKEVFHIVYDAWCFHQFVFDGIINRGKEKTPKKQIIDFAGRQHSSMLYLANERIEHCQIIGLLKVLDGKLVIADEYQSALNEAACKWRSLE